MLVLDQLPALYNGVSQQPPTLRLGSQAESQVNGWSSVADGLRKRPPSEHIAQLVAGPLSGAYVHDIDRDVTERYFVFVTDGNLRVFDANGVEQIVGFPSGKGYLEVPDGFTADQVFSLVTVADYTFVVNQRVTVELEAVGADTTNGPPFAYWLNRPRTEAGGAQQIQYPANPPPGVFRGSRQSLQDLPETAAQGDTYRIEGTTESNFASYFVRRDGGVWNETVAPGLRNLPKASTMPHALVRQPGGGFVFAPFSWAPRRVGDELTNPNPSFVGRRIKEVFFYKNRLGLAVDEGIVLSRVGDFGNFYRMTVLDALDDDVIDTSASEARVTKINHAVPLAGTLMLFADNVQFRINDGDVLRSTSVSLDVTTQYEMVSAVRPVPIGSDVYFASENGDWATVREYFVRDDANLTDAEEINGHCPSYIPSGVRGMTGSGEWDSLFLLTRGAPRRVYVYRYYWANAQEKAQSAWCYWEFEEGAEVLAARTLDDYLYLVIQRADGVHLERIEMNVAARAGTLPFQVYLDRRVSVQGTYLPTTDETVFQLPYRVAPASRPLVRVVTGAAFTGRRGALVNRTGTVWDSDVSFRIPGRHDAGPCFIGMSYTFRYEFSEQFIRDSRNAPVTTAKLQLRTWTVYYTNTAFFRTEVAPYGVAPEVEAVVPAKLADFTGRTLGDLSLQLGEPAFHEGSYSFQVYGNSDVARVALLNDSHLGCTFQAAAWEGFLQTRARFR